MDGRPADLPGDAVRRRRHPGRRTAPPARCRSATRTRPPGRTTTASRSTTASRPRSRPTDHAAMMRFTFPGDDASAALRQRQRQRRADPRRRRPASSPATRDVKSGLSTGATRMFVYGVVRRAGHRGGKLPDGGGDGRHRLLRASTPPATAPSTMRIATSLISVDQAKAQPRPGDPARRRLRGRSSDARAGGSGTTCWARIEVEGATRGPAHHALLQPLPAVPLPQLRLREHRHGAEAGHQYASAVLAAAPGAPRPTTGAKIVDGKVYVNNGFWDTYRTTWPAYSLLTPKRGGRAGRRLRPAVQGRRLDLPLVLARATPT